MKNPRLIILSGPSGVGKTSVAAGVLAQLAPEIPIQKLVTYTTRTPRPGEQDGVDYHFVTEEQFEMDNQQGLFFETTTYNGHRYGSPRSFTKLLEQGISCLAVTDDTVAQQVKREYPTALLIWLMPPSIEILKERLENRKSDSKAAVAARLALAEKELVHEAENSNFDLHIVNDNLSACVTEVSVIIRRAIN